MPFHTLEEIAINVSDVLRSSGMSPKKAARKNGGMMKTAAEALEQSKTLIRPVILYRELPVVSADRQGLLLTAGTPEAPQQAYIGGPVLAEKIPQAELLIVILMTLGPDLEQAAVELTKVSTLEGYILDCTGGAALRYMSNTVCSYFETLYESRGMKVSHPYDPGMEGWPVEAGQPEIFSLLDTEKTGVRLNEHFMMIPKKSMTMVIGVGRDIQATRRSCETCPSRNTCIYRRLNTDEQDISL